MSSSIARLVYGFVLYPVGDSLPEWAEERGWDEYTEIEEALEGFELADQFEFYDAGTRQFDACEGRVIGLRESHRRAESEALFVGDNIEADPDWLALFERLFKFLGVETPPQVGWLLVAYY